MSAIPIAGTGVSSKNDQRRNRAAFIGTRGFVESQCPQWARASAIADRTTSPGIIVAKVL